MERKVKGVWQRFVLFRTTGKKAFKFMIKNDFKVIRCVTIPIKNNLESNLM
ncbi:hypothetical protein HFP66_30680 [Bacillus sp. A17A.1]